MPESCRSALQTIASLTAEAGAVPAVESAVTEQIGKLAKASWTPGYCRALADNFASKSESRKEGVTFTTQELIKTGAEFEAFRITTFRNSGVAPKRYFGFVDGKGKASAYEKQMMSVAARVTPILNAYAAKHNLGVNVTPKEIVLTHIAEGAALLLSTRFVDIDRVHPVRGVGLDDFHKGFWQYQELVAKIDAEFKTRLHGAFSILGLATGAAKMTFEESVLGTSIMYLWEKAIAEQLRRKEGSASLTTLSLDEQFVHASLVYNSGILFADERVKVIKAFETAAYLVEANNNATGKRKKLAIMSIEEADALLERGDPLPDQPTRWSAIFHILQRYGAWVALARYSNVFTAEGMIAPAP